MKNILIIQNFNCSDTLRKNEINECIHHNTQIGFDEVIIFNDSIEPTFLSSHIKNIDSSGRLTYADFLKVVDNPANYGDLLVMTNSDIKLDPKILESKKYLKEKMLFVFTRYEIDGNLAKNPEITQDTWALLGQPIPKGIKNQSLIPLGLPGCELRFAEIFFSSGFAVFNPCLSVQNTHIHSKKTEHLDENRLWGAYLFTPACYFDDTVGAIKHFPTPFYLTSFIKKYFVMREH